MTYELRLRPFKRIFHPGTTMDKADWSLNGSYFETCNCETSCPCIWLQPPSEGNCTLLMGWHIESPFRRPESWRCECRASLLFSRRNERRRVASCPVCG